MARLFFALWPDDVTRLKLNEIGQQFKNEKVRLTKPGNLHITLEFLGEVSSEVQQELIEKAARINCEPFYIELTRISWWRKPAILWIGMNNVSKPLSDLVNSIKKCVKQQGLKTDQRPYKSHVTIARKVKQVIIQKETVHISLHVNSFALVVSKSTDTGVEYHVIQEWFLRN